MTLRSSQPDPLPLSGPYAQAPDPNVLRPIAATLDLVRTQVKALLMANPSFHRLSKSQQQQLANSIVKIAAYAAECIRDDWYQSTHRLQQRPLVKRKTILEAPIAQAQAVGDDFGAATNRVARVTEQTLRAIAFPTFVADLIQGTFNAIINANIQQLESYSNLLSNVGKTVDQFMADNISDNQARDWLAQRYPETLRVHRTNEGPRLQLQAGADERPRPNWRQDLNLSQDVDLDEDTIEEKLVPAARRQLAQQRLQLLSTMVLMGMNRIVVTAGKIRATMGFHIDATDRLHQEHATDFDFRTAASGSFGYGPWRAQASMSVAYVRSTRATSDAELNVEADLTGEVEIHFKGDYMPLERFATEGHIGRIRANTPVPSTNDPFGPIQTGGRVERYQSPRTQRTTQRSTQAVRPIGTLPEARQPVAPNAPQPSEPSQSSPESTTTTPRTTTPPRSTTTTPHTATPPRSTTTPPRTATSSSSNEGESGGGTTRSTTTQPRTSENRNEGEEERESGSGESGEREGAQSAALGGLSRKNIVAPSAFTTSIRPNYEQGPQVS